MVVKGVGGGGASGVCGKGNDSIVLLETKIRNFFFSTQAPTMAIGVGVTPI